MLTFKSISKARNYVASATHWANSLVPTSSISIKELQRSSRGLHTTASSEYKFSESLLNASQQQSEGYGGEAERWSGEQGQQQKGSEEKSQTQMSGSQEGGQKRAAATRSRPERRVRRTGRGSDALMFPSLLGPRNLFPSLTRFLDPFEMTFDPFDRLSPISTLTSPTTDWMLLDTPFTAAFLTMPKMDVVETDDAYEYELELPGVKKEDMKVRISEEDGIHYLRVTGQKEETRKRREGGIVHRERSTGSFSRTFALPEDINKDNIVCRFEHGVLKIHVPKEAGKEKTIEIQGEEAMEEEEGQEIDISS